MLWIGHLFYSLKCESLAPRFVTTPDKWPWKACLNNLPEQTWWILHRENMQNLWSKNHGHRLNTVLLQPVMDQQHQLVYSDSRCLGVKCFRCAAGRLRHSAFVLTHQVDVTIVTPRQINLCRLKGSRKSKPLFIGWILLFLSKHHFYLHPDANTRSSG